MSTKTTPWILLFGRTVLFIFFQSLFVLGFWLSGSAASWQAGAAWWPFAVTLTNLVCLALMISMFRQEGKRYWDIFRIQRGTVGKDLLALLASFVVIGPLGYFPNVLLAGALFENPETALNLLVAPLPLAAVVASIVLFPLTQGLVELALYFIYVMPRLDARPFPNLRPLILPALFLGLQHLAVPLLFNLPFILWRALMYLPFAIAVGLLLHWRPRLLPYMAVVHFLMDLSFAFMFLAAAY
jgi:membrane protease YdiL (CAAX protease family)